LLALLLLSLFLLPERITHSSVAPSDSRMPTLTGGKAIDHLKQQGSYQSLQEAIAAVQYEAKWQPQPQLSGVGAAQELSNRANNLLAYVTAEGLEVTSLAGEKKSWRLGLKLTGLGYGANLSAVSSGAVSATGNRVEIKRGNGFTEWFVNSNRGIEQGFTLSAPPESASRDPQSAIEPLRLRLAVSGALQATVNEAGSAATFSREADNVLLSYNKLFVTDAKGRSLAARLRLTGSELVIEVDDEKADYPLTIDPLLREVTRLTANDGSSNDLLGRSVAISGNIVIVGAANNFVQLGAAYVFVKSGTTWSQQAKLIPSDGTFGDEFGYSVAINGDTLVVASPFSTVGGNDNQGSAYVFVRSGTTWTEQQKLTASNGAAFDQYGIAVSISGDTIIVGARFADVGANSGQGSAYVYVRSGTTWTEQAILSAADGYTNQRFGDAVALNGDTVVVGARFDNVGGNTDRGSAYVFVRSGATWTQQAKLTASDGSANDEFGISVGISGDTVVVGAHFNDDGVNLGEGSAYVFVRSSATWTQQQKLAANDGGNLDEFGTSVAISGDTVIVGANSDDIGANGNQGSAYAFTRSGTTWTQQQKFTTSDGSANDQFGTSVALNGDTVVVGAEFDDVGTNSNQGSAYLFVCSWDQQAQLVATDGAVGDLFGRSVAIGGDTVVVGTYGDDVGANGDQGSAYVFVRSGVTWSQQAKLVAADGSANDSFGYSVAVSGNTVVVGAYIDNVGANVDQGSAYVFVRSGVTWTQQAQLVAADGAAGDTFGRSVAIGGDTVVVGAFQDDVGANPNQGSAYVFVRSGVTWTLQQKLTAADGAVSDLFGISVGISGDTVVIGAFLDDVGANVDQGSAYIFVRSGIVWSQQAQLTALDGAANDQIGQYVAVSGDTVVVGAFLGDVGANVDQGSAYIFVRSGVTWTQQAKLVAADGAANDVFGFSVAISGDTVVVGAYGDDVGANGNQGSAYVFVRSGVTWSLQQKLTAADGAAEDRFSYSAVAVSGNTVVVGAYMDDVGDNFEQGSAYIFFMGCNTSPTMLVVSGVTRQQGSPATVSTIANVFDSEDALGYLTVSVASAPAGISFTNFTNNNGTISAAISASCTAPLGTSPVILQVTDTDGAVGSVQLLVNVTANTLPTLGVYNDTGVAVSGSTTVTPNAPPADNGSIVQFGLSAPTFAGNLGFNPANGAVTVTNARPGGNHVVTITVTDNCGAIFSSAFILTVNCLNITVNPASIPAGTAGSAYDQVFTQTGGNGAITFSLSGALPTGLSFTGATLSGTPTQVGSFPVTITATDQTNCYGSRNYTLIINAPLLVWTGSTSSDWHTAANWTPNAVPAGYHDVLIPSSSVTNQPVIGVNSSAINAMTVQSGRLLTINSSRQLSTASDVISTGSITGGGTLLFDGNTFTQNGSVSVASVQFDAGSHTLTGGGSFASNILTVLNGASVALTSNHSVSVIVINSGGIFDASNQTLTLTGAGTAIFNSGAFTATGSMLIYQGAVAQVVTPNITYNNLSINNPAGVSLAGDTTVNGVLNLLTDLTTGAFTLTMPVSGSSTGTGDCIGNVKRTGIVNGTAYSFGDPLNTIRFDSGTAPSDVTVNLVKSAPAGFSNSVSRTYTITPFGGSGYSATLRLRYLDSELNGLNEAAIELWRYNGSTWQSPSGAAIRDTTSNWVEETGVTAFSPWTIAGAAGPTFVQLLSFAATTYEQGTLLEWRTGFEVNNLGFHVYREAAGTRQLVNPHLLAGSALTTGAAIPLTAGNHYAWWDGTLSPDAAYWLEDVDLNGTSTWHGPFYARKGDGSQPKAFGRSLLLSEVGANGLVRDTSRVVERTASATAITPAALLEPAPLASAKALKISVKQAGWYRLTHAELAAAGFDASIDPRLLQLFVDGAEVPLLVSLNKDGQVGTFAYLEFYGLGIDTPSTDLRTYWLTVGQQPGKRINQAIGEGAPSLSTSFTQTVERRDRTTYFAALRNGEAENFFGAVIATQPVEQTLSVSHLAPQTTEAILEVALQGVTLSSHRVLVQLNGNTAGYVEFSGMQQGMGELSLPHALLRDGANIVRLVSQNGSRDVSLVDHLRLSYQHTFTADGDTLTVTVTGNQRVTIDGFTMKAIRAFDVTDASNPQELIGEISSGKNGAQISIAPTEKGVRTLLAITDEQLKKPVSLSLNEASNWRSEANAADLVIISPSALFSSLEPLKALRESQGLRVALIDVEDVYDEFSFGTKSVQAVRDFFNYARTNWRQAPRYALLAGDASYDPKNYLGYGDHDLLPTKLLDTDYLETASDEWLADFNNDGIADLAVGRLPVRASDEANRIVQKIISYEWAKAKESVLLVSDRNDGVDFAQFNRQVRDLLPASVKVAEINRSGEDDEQTKRVLLAALNGGAKIVNYVGHGSTTNWNGNLLTAADAGTLTNHAQLSLFVMMNCLNGYFQEAANDSLSEALMKAESGAVAVWASSGMTLPQEQAGMDRELFRELFNPSARRLTLGEAMTKARSATSNVDVRRSWILFGDPSMPMK